MILVNRNPNLKNSIENYRKILSGIISLDFDKIKNKEINGFIKLNKDPKMEQFTEKNMIFRESELQMTDWLLGMAVMVGSETYISTVNKKKSYFKERKKNYFDEFLNRISLIMIIFIIISAAVNKNKKT